jgi:hypothetical protein
MGWEDVWEERVPEGEFEFWATEEGERGRKVSGWGG